MKPSRLWTGHSAAMFVALLGAAARIFAADENVQFDGVWVEDPAGRPVIDRGASGAWDHLAVDNPFLYVENNVYYCFYEGENQRHNEQVGLAVSRDLVHWTKFEGNPVLRVGPRGAWDCKAAKLPVVARHGDAYVMLYTGKDGRGAAIGLAASPDLRRWRKHGENPIVPGRPQGWDPIVTTCPSLVRKDGLFYTIYRGMTGFYVHQKLGLLASEDLLHWTRRDRPLHGLDDIYSLAICQSAINGPYAALAQERPPKHVYLSSDLVNWRRGPRLVFSAGHVDTPSQPIPVGDTLWILYEKDDRIYRARFVPRTRLRRLHEATLPFVDHFDDPQKSACWWKPVEGLWTFAKGEYAQESLGADWNRALLNTPELASCTISATAQVLTGNGWVGLCFEGIDGLFAFAVVHDGRNIARLFKSKSARWGDVDWVIDVPLAAHRDRPYLLRMAVDRERLRCWVDGVKVIERSDPSLQRIGRAGLFTAAASVKFDDVRVSGAYTQNNHGTGK